MSNNADHLKQHRWQKGQSGNPDGKPKGLVSLTRILNNALLDDHIEIKELGKGKEKKKVEVRTNYGVLIIMRMLDMAVAQGNDKMVKEIWDRIEGKAVQSINLGGQSGNPIELAEVDPDTQASIKAMEKRWFAKQPKQPKKPVAKTATVRQPSGNQTATKKRTVIKIKKK
jgi:hypothetical protein